MVERPQGPLAVKRVPSKSEAGGGGVRGLMVATSSVRCRVLVVRLLGGVDRTTANDDRSTEWHIFTRGPLASDLSSETENGSM